MTDDSWAADIDWDRHTEVYEELFETVESYSSGERGLHPEQMAMLLSTLRKTYAGRAEDERRLRGEYRLQHVLWTEVRDVIESDEWEIDWWTVSYVLYEMYEMARSTARRTSRDIHGGPGGDHDDSNDDA